MGTGRDGILASVARLDVWLQIVLVILVLTSAVRYVGRHGTGTAGVLILAGAVVLVIAYLSRPLTRWPRAWVAVVVVLWGALTIAAPSFAWCAVPVAFAVLQVVPFGPAATIVVVMTLLVTGAWWRISDAVDPTLVAGPVGIALVTTIAYRALDRETRARQTLLDELIDAQAELARQQHRTGALAERTRLSREIHDSVGQGLSSINLLLQAAAQSWAADPVAARSHVAVAATTARDSLDDVRRVVRDLAPTELADEHALITALRRAVAAAETGLAVEVRVDGTATPIPPEIATALVRTARGALANVREHADAGRVAVTLTYHADEVRLDVRDDGRGFLVGRVHPNAERGRGIRGISDRARLLGGSAVVESAPGEGTTLSVRFPLGEK